MAAKKAVAIKEKPKSKELSILEQRMLEDANREARREAMTSGFKHISTKGGMFSVDEKVIKGGQIEAVILMAVHTNAYYTGPYDPDSKTSPACYAFGTGDPEEEMRPHEAVKNPMDGGEGCSNCEMNFYGTADNGAGKACKNGRKLLMITEEGFEELESAEVVALNIPPTSLKNWSTYVQTLRSAHGRPLYGVQTLIEITQDTRSQFVITFKVAGLIQDLEAYDAIVNRLDGLFERVAVPYPEVIVTDKKPKVAAGKQATKKKPQGKVVAPPKKVTKAKTR